MDAIIVAEASVPPSIHVLDDHFNDPNWPDSDTPTPRQTDISLESSTYVSPSVDKIDATSILAPSSKDYDFDQCARLTKLESGLTPMSEL